MKYKERELIRDTLAASTNIKEDIEQVHVRLENIRKQIEPVQTEYDKAKEGADFKLLSKLKSELENLRQREGDAQMQLQVLEDAKEKFIQEQKLDADLILLKENQTKQLDDLHNKHVEELKSIEENCNKDYSAKEQELTNK